MINRWQLVLDTPRIIRDPLRYMLDCIGRYGNLVTLDFGFMQAFIVADPAAVQHVLVQNPRNYSKATPQFEAFQLVTGNGLLNSDGSFWMRQRRLAQPAFHRRELEKLGELMVQSAEARGAQWRSDPRYQQPVDMEQEMLTLSLPIICQALFGIDVVARSAELVEAVTHALDYVMFQSQMPLAFVHKLPLPVVRRYHRAMETLDKLIYELINERRAQDDNTGDLLSMLMFAADEDGNLLPLSVIRDEVMTLIVAGYETVASGLTWIWYLLSEHPRIAADLRAELAEQLGGRPPTLADLRQLPYLQSVVEEAFRIYPPSWLVSRKALADDTILGQHVPAGSLVIMSPYAMHHNPRLWDAPGTFDPQRFSAEAKAQQKKYQYMPFGAGMRLCIGNRFAEMETQLVLATLVQQFECRYVGAGAPDITAMVTVRPKKGMPMQITPLERKR